jgi:hypothetical protein
MGWLFSPWAEKRGTEVQWFGLRNVPDGANVDRLACGPQAKVYKGVITWTLVCIILICRVQPGFSCHVGKREFYFYSRFDSLGGGMFPEMLHY